MEHFFELRVKYKDEELNLKARLVTFGYVYKFHVIVYGKELIFEKDEEQNYRVLSEQDSADHKIIGEALLHAIIKSLEDIKKV